MELLHQISALLVYYRDAFLRSFEAAFGWIVSWSIIPGLLLALCVGVVELWPPSRKAVSGLATKTQIREHASRLLLGFMLFLVIMIGFAFIQDAPTQLANASKTIADLKRRIAELTPLPPTPPKRVYSDRQKKELSDLTSEIAKIVEDQGRTLDSKIADFVQLWDSDQRGSVDTVERVDVSQLEKRIGEIKTLDSELLVKLCSREGVFKGNSEYFDELVFLIRTTPDDINNVFQKVIHRTNDMNVAISAVKRTLPLNDPALLQAVMSNAKATLNQLELTGGNVRSWLDETRRRLKMVRDELA